MKKEKHIYFVRHGETDANADGVFRGAEARMTSAGEAQARAVAERIARISVEAVVSSPFPRTMETAKAIGERTGLPIEESSLFVERRRPSAAKGKAHADPEMITIGKEIFAGYLIPGHRHSDEENFDDLKERLLASLSFLEKHPKDRICVVTHGVFLKMIFAAMWAGEAMTGEDLQRALRMLFTNNAGVTHATFSSTAHFHPPLGAYDNSWQIVSWNDSAHLG